LPKIPAKLAGINKAGQERYNKVRKRLKQLFFTTNRLWAPACYYDNNDYIINQEKEQSQQYRIKRLSCYTGEGENYKDNEYL
jgi:hypothetical protein